MYAQRTQGSALMTEPSYCEGRSPTSSPRMKSLRENWGSSPRLLVGASPPNGSPDFGVGSQPRWGPPRLGVREGSLNRLKGSRNGELQRLDSGERMKRDGIYARGETPPLHNNRATDDRAERNDSNLNDDNPPGELGCRSSLSRQHGSRSPGGKKGPLSGWRRGSQDDGTTSFPRERTGSISPLTLAGCGGGKSPVQERVVPSRDVAGTRSPQHSSAGKEWVSLLMAPLPSARQQRGIEGRRPLTARPRMQTGKSEDREEPSPHRPVSGYPSGAHTARPPHRVSHTHACVCACVRANGTRTTRPPHGVGLTLAFAC